MVMKVSLNFLFDSIFTIDPIKFMIQFTERSELATGKNFWYKMVRHESSLNPSPAVHINSGCTPLQNLVSEFLLSAIRSTGMEPAREC